MLKDEKSSTLQFFAGLCSLIRGVNERNLMRGNHLEPPFLQFQVTTAFTKRRIFDVQCCVLVAPIFVHQLASRQRS